MDQIKQQGVSAAKAEQTDNRVVDGEIWKQAAPAPIQRPAETGAQQKIAKIGKQREKVCGFKAWCGQAQRIKVLRGDGDPRKDKTQHRKQAAEDAEYSGRYTPEKCPAEHTKSQAVQHTEADGRETCQNCNGTDQYRTAEDNSPPPQMMLPQRNADAGNEKKRDAAPIFNQKEK